MSPSRSTLPILGCLAITLALQAQAQVSEPVAAPTAQQLLEQFDTDQDGRLNLQELDTALKSLTDRPSAEADPKLEFIRVLRDSAGIAQSLETSVSSFTSKDGRLQVDLIGAVHVADRPYYEQLNQMFREYDVVLYELIAPEGTRIPRGGQPSRHPVGRLQAAVKSILDLAFQLEDIDYTAQHLVHADMSPEEFATTMKARGESFWKILFRMIGQASKQEESNQLPSDAELISAFFAPDRSLRLKRIMAGQFENLESQMALFEGPDGSTIISERNKRALDVLKRQIEAGHDKIAVFYGAGHMPDMAARLQADFTLQPKQTSWLKAWDMSGKK